MTQGTPAPGSPNTTNQPRLIEVTVSPTGETTIQSKGFAGASCRQATRNLEQALGVVASDQTTAEFYQSSPQQEQQRQSTG